MARAPQVSGLSAELPAYLGMQRILAGRIAELWSWGAAISGQENARELHDMRIAAKRLRYCLEFFADFLGSSAEAVIAKLKQLQDYLGEIHDCDVWADKLRKLLRKELKRTAQKSKGLKGQGGATEDLASVAELLVRGGAGERAVEIACLLGQLSIRRQEFYLSFTDYWTGLELQSFKQQLLGLVENAANEGKPDGS